MIRAYADRDELQLELLGRGFAWLDTGTSDSLIEAAEFVRALERRQGLRIACPEEVAFELGFIDKAQLERLGRAMPNSEYGKYLLGLANETGCHPRSTRGLTGRDVSDPGGSSATASCSGSRPLRH